MEHPTGDCAQCAVRDRLSRAAAIVDEGSLDDYALVYAPETTWEMGEVRRSGLAAVVAGAQALRTEGRSGPGSGFRHLVTPMTVDVTGATATALSYFLLLDCRATPVTIAAFGTYHDGLADTGAGWLITGRRVTM